MGVGAEIEGAGGNPTQRRDEQPELPEFDHGFGRFYLRFACMLEARVRVGAHHARMFAQRAQVLRSPIEAPEDDE